MLPSYGKQSNDLHSRLVGWFLCGGGTGAINGIIRECHSSQLPRASFIAKKKKKITEADSVRPPTPITAKVC